MACPDGTARPPSTDSPPRQDTGGTPGWPTRAPPPLACRCVAARGRGRCRHRRARRVLGGLPDVLSTSSSARTSGCSPVLAERRRRLPIGLRLALPSPEIGWGVEPGATSSSEGGACACRDRDVVAVRAWRPARVTAAAQPLDASALARSIRALRTATEGAVLRELTADLTRAALATPVPPGRLARLRPASSAPAAGSPRAATTPCAGSCSPCARLAPRAQCARGRAAPP